MDKEQLVKLAVVAGYTNIVKSSETVTILEKDCGKYCKIGDNPHIGQDRWQHHKDIAQAFEVLEGLGQNYDICKSDYLTDSYRVEIFYDNFNEDIEEDGPTVPEAICNAILKATEQG